jgi:hypothetical protein
LGGALVGLLLIVLLNRLPEAQEKRPGSLVHKSAAKSDPKLP